VTKVPGHGLHQVWLYVEAVRRRWSLSVAAAKPAPRIVDPRRGYPNFAAMPYHGNLLGLDVTPDGLNIDAEALGDLSERQ
jgi:hypothetical protein